jgi:hypothetical protein
MTTQLAPETKVIYQKLRDFLPVLSESQITKLRNLAIGVRDANAFTEEEVKDLELKFRERRLFQ